MRRGLALLLFLALACHGCGRVAFGLLEGDGGSDDGGGPPDASLEGPTDGLLAAFPLDDDPSDGARELTGNGVGASCSNCPVVEGGAYRFDGDSWIELDADPRFESPDAYTVSVWVRPERAGLIQTIVSKTYGTGSINSWQLSHRPGSGGCQEQSFQLETAASGSPSYDRLRSPDQPVVGGWFHVVGTWNGTEAALYVNGAEQERGPAEALFDGGIVRIGCDWDGGAPAHQLVGLIRDVRIYDRELSADEIDALLDTGDVVAAPAVGAVSGLVLVDAATDLDIGPLVDMDQITVAAGGVNVRAETTGSVGSVRFDLDGMMGYQVESTAPFSLEGDTDGDYDPWLPAAGPHTLTATPFCMAGASGASGPSVSIGFDVL